MPVPPAYFDECIDVRLAEALHQRGFIAVTSLAAGMLGSTDEDQLMYATTRGLMLVTHNRRHFRRLHRLLQEQRRSHVGIILLSRTTTLPRLRACLRIGHAAIDAFHGRLAGSGAKRRSMSWIIAR